MSAFLERTRKDPDHDMDSWGTPEEEGAIGRAHLYQEWMQAKEAERIATMERRSIEDRLTSILEVDALQEGSKTIEDGQVKVKVTSRMSRKIDADALQEIAAEHDLSRHLGDLFRWKPELNMAAWKAADESITKPLEAAITTKPGRPSFSIEVTKEV